MIVRRSEVKWKRWRFGNHIKQQRERGCDEPGGQMQVDFWDSLEEMSPYYLIEHDDKWEKIFFNISDV